MKIMPPPPSRSGTGSIKSDEDEARYKRRIEDLRAELQWLQTEVSLYRTNRIRAADRTEWS